MPEGAKGGTRRKLEDIRRKRLGKEYLTFF
jgi:hypothetical protein